MSDTKYSVNDPAVLARMVAEGMQDGIWVYDCVKQVTHYSDDFIDIFGPTGAINGPGKPVKEIAAAVNKEDMGVVLENWNRLLETGQRFRAQFRIRDQQGAWRWLASTIYAVLRNPDGTPDKAIGFHLDITEAMQTEQNLAATQEHLRLIFVYAGIGIVMTTTDGKLKQVNPALARMLGREEHELLGRHLSDFAYPEDRESMEANLTRLVAGGRREMVSEQRFLRPDGMVIWANLTATLSTNRFDGERLTVVMVEDVTERLRQRYRLQYDATHDVMTGAWSRWVLLERLGQHVNLALRHNLPMAFCMCDLDHFKLVNDRHGHQAGDQVLIHFVKELQDAVRDTDIVGRYGGEEFGVVFPNTTVAGAIEAMHRVRTRMRDTTFHDPSGGTFRVTASFGLCGVHADSSIRSVVSEADSALYEGKRLGRNRVVAREAGEIHVFSDDDETSGA